MWVFVIICLGYFTGYVISSIQCFRIETSIGTWYETFWFSNSETSYQPLIDLIRFFRRKNAKIWFCEFSSLFVWEISLVTLYRVVSVFEYEDYYWRLIRNFLNLLLWYLVSISNLFNPIFQTKKCKKLFFFSFRHYLFRTFC